MAEVFGIVSAAISVFDVSSHGIQRLQRVVKAWRNAPAELLALQNEAGDLRCLLDEIRNAEATIKVAAQHNTLFITVLHEQLQKAEDHFHSLSGMLDELAKLKRHKQKFGWIRQEGRVEKLKSDFRQVRENMNTLLLAHNVTKTTRLELDILSIRTTDNLRYQSLTTALDLLRQRSNATHNLLDWSYNDLLHLLSPIPLMDERTRDILSMMINNQATTEASRTGIMDAMQQLSSQINNRLDALASAQAPEQSEARPGPSTSRNPRSLQYDTISIRTRRRGLCLPACPCCCHSAGSSSGSWRMPRGMSHLYGGLFVRYTGWPVRLFSCDSASCVGTQSTRVEVTYIFPSWLVWYTVCIIVEKAVGRRPEMALVLRNREDFDSNPLFRAAYSGDVGLVMSLLREAPYLVKSIRDRDGVTPLWLAVRFGNVDIVKLFLEAGADPYQEPDNAESAIQHLTRRVLRNADTSSEMCRLLGVQDYLEEVYLELPEITKAVLRLPGCRRMETLIQTNRPASLAGAQMEDVFGNTTLHWACERGDFEAVRMLLELGVDADAQTRGDRRTALHCAALAQNGSPACITLLCQAGARFRYDFLGSLPLHTACAHGTAETVAELVRMGASLESSHTYGLKALHIAAQYGKTPILDWILDHGGVDINSEASGPTTGETAIVHAVGFNSYECARSLLLRGADRRCRHEGVWTVLHSAAKGSDVRILRLLASHDLAGLDIHAKYRGQTARNMFDLRKGKGDELIAAFNELLDSIEHANARLARKSAQNVSAGNGDHDHIDHASSEDEIFYEAEEDFSNE